MPDYYTSFSVVLPIPSKAKIQKAQALYARMSAEKEAGDEGSPFLFEVEADADGLWIRDDAGEGDMQDVIVFVIQAATELKLQGVWTFSWALTASRPVLDAFGGGAAVIDLGKAELVETLDASDWAATRKDEVENPTPDHIYTVRHAWNDDGAGSVASFRSFEGAVLSLRNLVEESCSTGDEAEDAEMMEKYGNSLLAEIDGFKPGQAEYDRIEMGDCFLQLSFEVLNA